MGRRKVVGTDPMFDLPPRLHTADQACRSLVEFLALAKDVPAAAEAFSDRVEFGRPVIEAHIDVDETTVAGKYVFRFQLSETLMRYMTASRAGQGVDPGAPPIGS